MQAGVGLLILDVMPIYMTIPLNIVIIICSFINCPTVIVYPQYAIFSREATSEIYGPRVYFLSYCFQIYYFKKPKNTLLHFFIFLCFFFRSMYPISHNLIHLNTEEGLTTPLTRWVASICSLCAGTVYIVLLGSPTRLITLVHN